MQKPHKIMEHKGEQQSEVVPEEDTSNSAGSNGDTKIEIG